MSEYFGEAINVLEAISETARSIAEVLESNAVETIKAVSRFRIAARLVKEAKSVMAEHVEYSYPALQEHLLRNLTNIEHVKVDDGLTKAEVFNTEIGGTAADLEGGLYKSSHDDKTRSLGWRFGIFLPARGGGAGFQWSKKSKPKIIADYETVIQERLAAWGDKAPYWYFLEHGNEQVGGMKGGTPYPRFGAGGFIDKTRQAAPELIERTIREFEADAEASAEMLLEEADFMGKSLQIRVDIKELGPGWSRETWLSSGGKVFIRYRTPAGTWGKPEDMIASAD